VKESPPCRPANALRRQWPRRPLPDPAPHGQGQGERRAHHDQGGHHEPHVLGIAHVRDSRKPAGRSAAAEQQLAVRWRDDDGRRGETRHVASKTPRRSACGSGGRPMACARSSGRQREQTAVAAARGRCSFPVAPPSVCVPCRIMLSAYVAPPVSPAHTMITCTQNLMLPLRSVCESKASVSHETSCRYSASTAKVFVTASPLDPAHQCFWLALTGLAWWRPTPQHAAILRKRAAAAGASLAAAVAAADGVAERPPTAVAAAAPAACCGLGLSRWVTARRCSHPSACRSWHSFCHDPHFCSVWLAQHLHTSLTMAKMNAINPGHKVIGHAITSMT